MISFDFNTYNDTNIATFENKKEELISKLYNDEMSGFINNIIDDNEVNRIIDISNKIKENSDILIVIGIGGSFMGSFAISEMFKNHFKKKDTELIYLGTNLSTNYLLEVIDYIKDKDVTLNVISKSGTTLEVSLVYKIIKTELEKKYSNEELKSRIIITTDKENGKLREEAINNSYTSFEIPSDIGGRYSLITAAHLLPLAVANINIKDLIAGYKKGIDLIDKAYIYASNRIELFKKKKYIENFSVYQDNLYYYTEWIKQLFGESEGKNNLGIFPVSTVNTRDLHSLGQFIQEGNNIIFETVIKVEKDNDLKINNTSLNELNNIVINSVCRAHKKGNTPSVIISLDKLTIENIGMLSMFFMLSAVFSSYLFGVNPYNQPGVEEYKKEVKLHIDSNL